MGSHITFNAICPGYVDTPIIDRNLKLIQNRGFGEEDALNMMISANPHKRLIPPKDIAEAALWLCSPHSSSVNGQTVEVAGGQI